MEENEEGGNAGNEESEERPAMQMSQPSQPSIEDVKSHEITHLPFRNWCAHCVKGKCGSAPHAMMKEETQLIPTISVDYAYSKSEEEREDDDAELMSDSMPIMICKDRKSKMISANVVPEKGANKFAIKKLAQEIVILGYNRIAMKTDDENAVLALKRAAKR